MGIASSVRKAVKNAMAKVGGDVTIRYVSAGSYNATTGVITESESDTTVPGVLENVSSRLTKSLTGSAINELIQSGDKSLTIAAADLTTAPETKDRVVIGGIVHQIIIVKTIEQDNIALSYQLLLRV